MKLKLIKASSYTGLVKATKAQPIVEVDNAENAQALTATGYFEIFETCETDDKPVTEISTPDYEKLSAMTKSELADYAQSNGIDTAECKTKADILEVISIANGGSPTMIDLQKQGGE